MGLEDISYRTISCVLESWELGRQKFSCSEEVSVSILLKLFEKDSSTKTVFGFQPDQDVVNSSPIVRMGILVHAGNIIQSIDSVLSLLGPDTETLELLLAEQGRRHLRMGVQPEHVPLLGEACREALSEIIPSDKWTEEVDTAWKDLFGEVSAEMVKSMV